MAIVLNTLSLTFNFEAQTLAFSQQLAQCCKDIDGAIVIYLTGDLGAGKTTLARGFIQYFGFERVKSPTYSLVESYQNEQINIHHFDCYRLSDPQELDYIGVRDYSGDKDIQLIEWPSLGLGAIAKADISLALSGYDEQRQLMITSHSKIGNQLLESLRT